MEVDIFHKAEHQLAEAPYWCQENKTLYWVDILNKSLFTKSLDGQFAEFILPESLSSLFVRDSFVYGCTESGYCEYNLATNKFRRLVEIEMEISTNRSNDGKYDGEQGFVFGTMSWSGSEKTGKIYHVDTDKLKCKILDTGFFIPNGFAFNTEFSEIVIADSYIGKIFKYDYDAKRRELKNKREIADVSDAGFSPDGMTTTKDNKFWNAKWDGCRVDLYDFNGRLLDSIALPVLRPTSCALGGLNEEALFVTTATEGLTEKQINNYPFSGSILKVDMSKQLSPC